MANDVTRNHGEHMFAIRLMQHLVVPTFVLDPDGRVIIWNKACERLTKVSADEVLGTRNHWKAFYGEPRDCLADLIVTGDTNALGDLYTNHSIQKDVYDGVRAENWCIMPQSSTKLYLAINAGPIYDDEGQLIAVVETLRDMTEQKHAEEALQKLAMRDGLTGLSNRRSFDQSLESLLLHAQREQVEFSLILVDVDHFKPYNDTYGHHQGDECLKVISAAIAEQLKRPMDIAARYGGEEFAIILPQSGAEGAKYIAERVREAVFDLNLVHQASTTADRVTVSSGFISLIPEVGQKPCEVIERADKALYQAKSQGRNQVCQADFNQADLAL